MEPFCLQAQEGTQQPEDAFAPRKRADVVPETPNRCGVLRTPREIAAERCRVLQVSAREKSEGHLRVHLFLW